MEIILKKPVKYEVVYIGFKVPIYPSNITISTQDKDIVKNNLIFEDGEEIDVLNITGLVDIDTGKLINWAETNQEVDIFAKVRDEGLYTLYDIDMNMICSVDSYVPSIFECNECGWGDYFNMTIEPTGYIKNWRKNWDSKVQCLKDIVYGNYD